MKTSTKIWIGAGVVGAGALVVGAMAYKKAAENLTFSMGAITPLNVDDNGLQVRIDVKVKNDSRFVFPIPQAFIRFNVAGKIVGSAATTQWQVIGSRGEYIIPLVGTFKLNELGGLITILYNSAKLPDAILYDGHVQVGKYSIPFSSSYAIGKIEDTKIKSSGRVDQYWNGKIKNYSPTLLKKKVELKPYYLDPTVGANRFDLYGIEFGNWMNQEDRASHLTASMVSFDDLATVLNVSPSKIGFNKELSLALGARGTGGLAAAHYERGTSFVINLTKTMGAGSLAHEYGHFLDNIMAMHSGGKKNEYATGGRSQRTKVDHELLERKDLSGLLEKIFETLYWDKDGNPTIYLVAQRASGSDYLLSRTEVFARTFEQYVRLKLKEKGIKNEYLVTATPDRTEPPLHLVKLAKPYIDKAINIVFGKSKVLEHNPGKAETKPNKAVKASKTQAIKDVLPLFPDLKEMEANILYSTFSETDEIKDVADGLKKSILKKLEYKYVESTWDGLYYINENGERFISKVKARLQTLQMKKSGADLFPEIAKIGAITKPHEPICLL